MLSTLLASTLLVSPSQRPAPGGPGAGGGTLLLQIEGRPGALRVVRARKRPWAFSAPRLTAPDGRVLLLDGAGRILREVPLDLGPFTLDGGPNAPAHVVLGDTVQHREVGLLVKIPDIGQALDRVEIRSRRGGREAVLGRVTRAAIERAAAGTSGPAGGPIVKTILKNGPVQNRYDIVILGDGYRAVEVNRFYQDVNKWLADLFGREPYRTYKSFFNVHTVFRASQESGADHPDRKPPIYRNTAYDASYNTGGVGRCLYIRNGTLARSDAALAPDVEGRIVVFVNDSRYGGCAGTFSVSYNGYYAGKVQSHEFGHSFGGLADEYDYGRSGTYNGPEPRQPNITKDPTGKAKWPLWLGTNGIGAYRGAGYYKYGLYRPKLNCLMRALSAPLCEICVEELAKRAYAKVTPIENPLPSQTSVTIKKPASQVFSFTDLTPGTHIVSWSLDGTPVQSGGTRFTLASSTLGPGKHTLSLVVQDKTAFVRKDPTKMLLHRRDWVLSIVDVATWPDLTITSFQTPASTPAGSTVQLVTSVKNQGGGPAGAFELEHFLSLDSTLTTNDIYLGAATVAGLARGAVSTVTRSVTLPLFATPGAWYFGAWVDRKAAVNEQIESNNTALAPITLAAASGCPARLEFEAPLLYPYGRQRVSLIWGGSAKLHVAAPCRQGDYYLLLWSCKGTSPGMRLPGGFRLPLNWDPVCTAFGLATLNSYPFRGTFGRLDANGLARADLFVPPLAVLTPLSTHFAGIFFDPNFRRITGVSAAAAFDLTW